ncbi:MAG: RNA-binding S4 domain-containing protein [Oscillospiraceae bacterium]|nr:RNA-binding S4 domain-containing protein [Oscillospiraceae bacterium]
MKELFVLPEYIKLDQALKLCGIAESGSMAKDIILDGFVKVNEEVCFMRGKKLREGDKFSIDDEEYIIKFKG